VAIAYRSRSDTTHAGAPAGSTITLTKPTGTTDGDYLLLIFEIAYGTNGLAVSSNPPGWTLFGWSGPVANGSGTYGYTLVYGKSASSEPASWDWVFNNAPGFYNCQAVAFSGVSATTPYEQNSEVYASNQADGATISRTATTTGVNELLVTVFGSSQSTGDSTYTENVGTEQYDTSSGTSCNVALNTFAMASPATQQVIGTVSHPGKTSAMAAVQVALIPDTLNVAKTLTPAYIINSYVAKTLTGSYGISGYAWVDSSLFDFDSSLFKFVRGVKIDFDPATDGDGGSVDVYYRLNKANAVPTLLATNIVSGTEYMIDQQCRSVGIRCVLKKGTSTSGPTLKRFSIRAAPDLQQFRRREFVLDLSGTTDVPQQLRDGTMHPKSGREQADDLNTAAKLQTPFTITDRFGTFTGFIDLNDAQGYGLFEIHPSTDEPGKSGTFIAQVLVREV
jgi:hypothetical protein